ncbi:HupE/UreJ family protein, partial [Rhodospirillales bacterium]|nr:HupE/UreJ family protein [Rhodospirillales bacterium]
AAIYTKQRFTSPMVYIVAMLFGCYAMSTGIGLPAKEVIIGLFLLTLGAVVLSDKALSLLPAIAIFAGFGLFHGSAFGDALASQEAGIGGQVLIGYLVGLSAIQYAIALGAGWLVAKVLGALTAQAIQARLAGAVVAGVGLFLTLENVEGIVFDLMGWTS